jgi:hypothetical protein
MTYYYGEPYNLPDGFVVQASCDAARDNDEEASDGTY